MSFSGLVEDCALRSAVPSALFLGRISPAWCLSKDERVRAPLEEAIARSGAR